ncbi:MAG: hypothetical protein IKK11_06915 [Oscillospiraceae bacterium]|nr:hypothetical protein [Oscillospiraceae bacterium]
MSTDRFTAAMGYIDDDLISDAVTYMPKKKSPVRWMKWVAVAACFCLVVGLSVPGLFKDPSVGGLESNTTITDAKPEEGFDYATNIGFPLVLTAYAMESDNNVSTALLQEGESVPVSLFETESNTKGFVFSYNITTPGQTSSVSIMTEGEFPGIIYEIAGLEMDKTKNYIYYIPEQSKTTPYFLMIPYSDIDDDMVYEYHIIIEENETGYIATVDHIVTHERKTAP